MVEAIPHARTVSYESNGDSVMARVLNGTANLVQADVSSILAHAYAKKSSTPTTDVLGGGSGIALTVADVVFNALQTTATDPKWTKDSTGYNFKWDMPYNSLTTVDIFQVEIVFTMADASEFTLVVEIDKRNRIT